MNQPEIVTEARRIERREEQRRYFAAAVRLTEYNLPIFEERSIPNGEAEDHVRVLIDELLSESEGRIRARLDDRIRTTAADAALAQLDHLKATTPWNKAKHPIAERVRKSLAAFPASKNILNEDFADFILLCALADELSDDRPPSDGAAVSQ